MNLYPLNYLNISQDAFGTAGINTGNIIYNNLQSQEKKYDAQYNRASDRVVILNSSDLPHTVLNQILYGNLASNYQVWFPQVMEKRDESGNLLIKLSSNNPLKSVELTQPHVSVITGISRLIKKDIQKRVAQVVVQELLPNFIISNYNGVGKNKDNGVEKNNDNDLFD